MCEMPLFFTGFERAKLWIRRPVFGASPPRFEMGGLVLDSDSTFEIRVRFGFDFSGFVTALVCWLVEEN